jgi:hypothetical protein
MSAKIEICAAKSGKPWPTKGSSTSEENNSTVS